MLLFHHIPKEQWNGFERLVQRIFASHAIITPDQAEAILEGRVPTATNGRVPVLFTFDDGFKSQLLLAKEVLHRYGVKGLFFVCPGLLTVPQGKQQVAITRYIFDGQPLPRFAEEPALLSWKDVEDLAVLGHTVGSHTAFHRRLSQLSAGEVEREVFGSADLLEKQLGRPVTWFAYPFGNIESIDASSCEVIGKRYRFSCSGIRGLNSKASHPLALLRDEMAPDSPADYQEFILRGGLDFYYRNRARRLHLMAKNAYGIH